MLAAMHGIKVSDSINPNKKPCLSDLNIGHLSVNLANLPISKKYRELTAITQTSRKYYQ
jgi:hypothetical protein